MNAFIKVLLRNSILILIGTITGLFILEIGVRLVGAKPETYLRKFSRYHSILGWEKTPNMEGTFRRGDVTIYEKMNSKGLRDSDYDYEKPNGTFRLLILGDSFTEGYDVEIEHNFTEILERKLNQSLTPVTGLNYEVINAGTGGYSTDQEYLFYKLEGYKYKPDIVILMTYATNDIYYNSQPAYGNYHKPLFVQQGDSLILSNVPLPEVKKQETLKDLFRDMALYPIVTKSILLYMPSFAEKLSSWGFISKSTLEGARVNVKNPNLPKYPPSFLIYAIQENEIITRAWKVTDLLIRDLHNLSKINGSKFLWVSIPDRFQIYPDSWENTKAMYTVNDTVWDPQLPDTKLTVIAEKYQISFLKLSKFFLTNAGTARLYNGVHWNVKGNELVAEFLFQELTRENDR